MNAENGWLTTIEGHSNKTYSYSLRRPKAYFGKGKVWILVCFFLMASLFKKKPQHGCLRWAPNTQDWNIQNKHGRRKTTKLTRTKVENDWLGSLLKLPIFVVQKAAPPKNGVEFRQMSIDVIKCSLTTSYDDMQHHATLPNVFCYKSFM